MSSPESAPPRVLIVDADPIAAESLSEALRGHGYETATALNADEALAALADAQRPLADRAPRPFGLVITDLNLPKPGGVDLLRRVRRDHPDVVAIVLTAYGTIEAAVNAIKLGAFDYLTHPIVEEELVALLERAVRHGALVAQNHHLRRQLDDRFGLDNIIGRDPRMLRIYDLVEAVAPTKTSVLMTGESGTGKSLVARAIHQRSPLRDQPFIEISCGSIPETLLESELFGHVKGAFTGAHADKIGRFLAADGGTIFLDEINSASPGMQLKLLRVLQEKRFEPVGSTKTVEVNVRVVLASNEPLEQLVATGQFRQDLYYRINVVKIELPPLRDRLADVPTLAEHFLERQSRAAGREILGFTPEAMAALQRYSWPGNVRELENVVERAVVLSRGARVGLEDFPANVVDNRPGQMALLRSTRDRDEPISWDGETLAEALEAQERRVLLAALNSNNWNRNQTAAQLGINRTTLYKKIRSFGLDQYPQAG